MAIAYSNTFSQICVINDGRPIEQGEKFIIKISQFREYEKKLKDQKICRVKIIPPEGVEVMGEDIVNVRKIDEITFNLYPTKYLNYNDSITIILYGYSLSNRIASIAWRSTLKYPIALSWSIISFLGLYGGADISESILAMNEALWKINRPHYLRRSITSYYIKNYLNNNNNVAYYNLLKPLPYSKKKNMLFDISSDKVVIDAPDVKEQSNTNTNTTPYNNKLNDNSNSYSSNNNSTNNNSVDCSVYQDNYNRYVGLAEDYIKNIKRFEDNYNLWMNTNGLQGYEPSSSDYTLKVFYGNKLIEVHREMSDIRMNAKNKGCIIQEATAEYSDR